MNFINYLQTVLKTNPNFDETQINRFVSYFLEVAKWNNDVLLCFSPLNSRTKLY